MGQVVPLNENLSAIPRAGEMASSLARSNRFKTHGGLWFYRTREGRDIGPYASLSVAEKAVGAFTDFAQKVQGDNLSKLINAHLIYLGTKAVKAAEQPLRAGEWEAPPQRSNRVFQKEGCWYFRTRESKLVGPYDSRKEAESSVKMFTEFAEAINVQAIESLIATMNDSL